MWSPEGLNPCPDGLNKIKECCYYNDLSFFFGDTVDDIKAGCDASVDVLA